MKSSLPAVVWRSSGVCWYETYSSTPRMLLNSSAGRLTIVDLRQHEQAAIAVDGRSLADPHRVLARGGDVEPLGDAGTCSRPVVSALAVEVVRLLVDEVLVLQELPVEEARPLLDGVGSS